MVGACAVCREGGHNVPSAHCYSLLVKQINDDNTDSIQNLLCTVSVA